MRSDEHMEMVPTEKVKLFINAHGPEFPTEGNLRMHGPYEAIDLDADALIGFHSEEDFEEVARLVGNHWYLRGESKQSEHITITWALEGESG